MRHNPQHHHALERPKGARHPQGTPGGIGRASGARDRGDGDGPNGNNPNGGSLAH